MELPEDFYSRVGRAGEAPTVTFFKHIVGRKLTQPECDSINALATNLREMIRAFIKTEDEKYTTDQNIRERVVPLALVFQSLTSVFSQACAPFLVTPSVTDTMLLDCVRECLSLELHILEKK